MSTFQTFRQCQLYNMPAELTLWDLMELNKFLKANGQVIAFAFWKFDLF